MKTKLVIAIIAIFVFSGCEYNGKQANGILTAPTTNGLVDPAFAYEIDTWGANSEVYEFTPASNDEYTCVMLMLDNAKAVGFQCFPKKIKK